MDGGGGGAPPALEKNAAELTVMDVYDIASAVGQEFERVIDQHGCEAIARLMPKVVRVLEILEVLVSRNHINPEMEELRLELDRLRLERMDRIEKERKHQKVRTGPGPGLGGDTGRGRAALSQPDAAGWGEKRAPAPQPLGKTKREAGVRAGGAAGAGSRALRGCCLSALRVWVCFGGGGGFFSFPPGSFLPSSFSPPPSQSPRFLPLVSPR